jgi:H+/gluconate symporter-like permease
MSAHQFAIAGYTSSAVTLTASINAVKTSAPFGIMDWLNAYSPGIGAIVAILTLIATCVFYYLSHRAKKKENTSEDERKLLSKLLENADEKDKQAIIKIVRKHIDEK